MRRAALAGLLAAIALPSVAHAHRVRVTVPAVGDVTLAEIHYAAPAHRPGLHLALAGPIGAQYVAAAALRHQPRGALVVLVAVVNRRAIGATPVIPQAIDLRTRLTRPAKAPKTSQSVDVLAKPPAPPPPACALGALDAGALRVALHTGTAPSGFGVRSTVVQALAAACGRAVAPTFRTGIAPPVPPVPKCPPPCGPQPYIICPGPAAPRLICPPPVVRP